MIDQEISLFSDWSDLSQFRTGARLTDPINAGALALKLRRLLLDSNPLVHLVNQTKKKKILFPIEPSSVETISNTIHLIGDVKTNDVGKIENPNKIALKKIDDFLKYKILSIEGHSYSIKDIISTVANNLGGVHFDLNSLHLRIKFDPKLPYNAAALIMAICTIAKLVSIGLRELAESCSPFPPNSKCIGHYSADPGVVDFEPHQSLGVTYGNKLTETRSFAIFAVLEMKPQIVEKAVLYTLQDSLDSEAFKISFNYLGDLIVDLHWTGNDIGVKMLDEGMIRPIGKKIFLAVCVESTNECIKILLQINNKKSSQTVVGNFNAIAPYRSVLAADHEGKNGCAVRISELMILTSADEKYLRKFQKYAYYRYSLAN